jgi:hypothetical protein
MRRKPKHCAALTAHISQPSNRSRFGKNLGWRGERGYLADRDFVLFLHDTHWGIVFDEAVFSVTRLRNFMYQKLSYAFGFQSSMKH